MEHDVDKSDLWDLRDSLTKQIADGFKGVHDRQDMTNGRLGKAEIRAEQHDVRLTNVEREVFTPRRRTDPHGDNHAKERQTGERRVTDRDIAIALGALAAAVGALKVLPLLLKAFQ